MIGVLRERFLPRIKDLEVEVNQILASGSNEGKLADLRNETSRFEDSFKNRVPNASRMTLDEELLQYVTGLVNQERAKVKECRDAFATLQCQSKLLTIAIGLIQDALENFDKVLDTDLVLAREFLVGMVTRILSWDRLRDHQSASDSAFTWATFGSWVTGNRW